MASRLLILIFPCLFNTSPKIPTKFFHAAHLGNLNQIINQYGDEKSALSAVQDLEEYSWNYRKCFFEEMSKTARLYRDQGKGDHWVFTAIEVFDKW